MRETTQTESAREVASAPGSGARPGPKPPSNLALRVVTAVIGLPLILLLLFKGPPWGFFLLVLPACMLGAYELLGMTHPDDAAGQYGGVGLTAAVASAVFFGGADARVFWTTMVVIPFAAMLFTLVRLGDVKTAALRMLALAAAPVMVGVPLALLAVMRRDRGSEGPSLVLLALAFSWAADTGGYFAGRFFGKHPLYPAVSPKKTIEGAVGGLAASVAFALVYRQLWMPQRSVASIALLALTATVLGQAGDLGESLLKRSVGVKDSGAIVPGHGGILDRVDALLLTSVVVFLYTLWFPTQP
jgi:phosphatidate cytidylyltransferase